MSIQEQKITEAAIAANGVQSQPDKLTGTAAQNKKVFDALVTAVVRERFNALLDELTGTGAAGQLGITTISGFSADNIQSALEEIIVAMQEITQGSVMDGSITLAKLAAEVTAAALGGAPASHTHAASAITSGTLAAARIPALTGDNLASGAVTAAKIASGAVTSDKIAAGAVDADRVAALAIITAKIANKAITAAKIADKTITAAQIADATLTAAKMADKTITAAKLADNISYTKFGITANQVRTITAGTADPSGGSEGDIYIQYAN